MALTSPTATARGPVAVAAAVARSAAHARPAAKPPLLLLGLLASLHEEFFDELLEALGL